MMKRLFLKLISIGLVSVALMGGIVTPMLNSIPVVQADESSIPSIPQPNLLPGPGEEATQDDVQEYFLGEAIPNIISIFLGLISGFAVLAMIWAGIQYILAFGEEEKITAAKRTAIWGIVGFGIAILSYAIVSVINTLAFPDGAYDEADQETVIYEDI